ncbi:MAG: anti sigma factor C-terminal domain-containing protein [Clostridia bacterium]|nr:anti sigma factor C-terminal domain-containing protein [Clostridia bacterium]
MTYREKLDLYAQGALDKEETEKVEETLEKHAAIREFLSDEPAAPALETLREEPTDAETQADAAAFSKQVNKYIRRAFLKAGAVVLAVVLLVVFLLPQAADVLFYDPGKTVPGTEINRMTLDLRVYSELFLPHAGPYTEVYADSRGWGEYEINAPQTITYNKEPAKSLVGKISRGKLNWYTPDYVRLSPINLLKHALAGVDAGYVFEGDGSDMAEVKTALGELPASSGTSAFVTLDTVMTFAEFADWAKKNDAWPYWCAVCLKTNGVDQATYRVNRLFGVYYGAPFIPGDDQIGDTGKLYAPSDFDDMTRVADGMQEHAAALLDYAENNRAFINMMEGDSAEKGEFTAMADNIRENGLFVYGFFARATAEDFLALSEKEHVAYICVM